MDIKKLKKKYNNLSVTVKASLWFTICSIIQKGMSFVTVPVFTRMMTTEEYGYVTLYQSWLNILTIICTLNTTYGGFYNGMVRYKNDKESYTSATVFLTTLLTSFCFAIYLCFRGKVARIFGLESLLIVLMFVEILSKSVYDVWVTRQKYEFNYRSQTIVSIACVLVTPLLGIVLVSTMNDKVLGRILSFVIVYFVLGIVLYIFLLKRSKSILKFEYWRFTISFCVPLIPHYLAQSVLSQSDRIMINNLIGTREAAIYGFSYNIAMFLSIIYQAINTSFIPWLYRKMERKEYKSIANVAQNLLILVAVLVSVITLFAPEAVYVLGGKEYYDAILVIPAVVASVFFMFLYSLFSNVEAYFEKNTFMMFASIVAAVLNLVLNYIFIPLYGYSVAGYTTLFCYIVISIAHYICMQKVCRIQGVNEKIYDIKHIVLISFGVVISTVVSLMLYKNTFIRYAIVFVILIAMVIKRKSVIDIMKKLKKKQ